MRRSAKAMASAKAAQLQVRRILEHLGLAADAPPVARARDPTDELDEADAGAPM